MIRSLDRSVGRVLDALREQGLEENTSEFVGSRSRLTRDRGTATFTGGYMQVSYFLTGEQRPYVRT